MSESEFQWDDLRVLYMRVRKPVLILGILGGLVGVMLTFVVPKVWRAPLQIQLEDPPKSQAANLFSAYENLLPAGMGGATGVRSLALLKSSDLALQMAKREDVSRYLFKRKWDAKKNQWKKKAPSDQDYLEKFLDALHVNQNEVTGLIRISLNAPGPDEAISWPMDYLDLATSFARDLEIDRIRATAESIEQIAEQQNNPGVREQLYENLANKTLTAQLIQAENIFTYRLISSPVVPDFAASPKKRLFGFFGGVLGGLLGLGVAFIPRKA
ncbi:hypothetical protein H8E52_00465 [bacterium]|nr:hypothetical protein [bacterium]